MLSVNNLIGFGAGGPGPIQFVGGVQDIRAKTGDVSLTALTGGIDTAARAGDLVVAVIQGNTYTSDINVAPPTGYTEVLDIWANGSSYDTNLSVSHKVMGSTPDSVLTVSGNVWMVVGVFRNVDPVTPLDALTTNFAFAGAGVVAHQAITTVTPGAWVIGIQSHAAGAYSGTLSLPPGFSNLLHSESIVGLCTKELLVPAAEPSANWGTRATSANGSIVGAALALRPAS